MSEATTTQHDPTHEHADLLGPLTPAQRDAVVASLRHSTASGWPPSRATVSSLVAYAQGRITAKEYAAEVMVALGYADAQTAAALLDRSGLAPPEPTSRFDASVGFDFLFGR